MLQKIIGKCTEVVVKQGSKIIVATVGAAVVGTASVISYNLGRKKATRKVGKKLLKYMKTSLKR